MSEIVAMTFHAILSSGRIGRAARCGAMLIVAGCTGEALLFGPLPESTAPLTSISGKTLDTNVSVAQPATVVQVPVGQNATVQWADIVTLSGTSVRVQVQRVAVSGNTTLPDAFTGPVIHLIGDGTPGNGRDARADGDNDIFFWDTTGVRVGRYLVTITLEAPDGTSETVDSHDPDRNTQGAFNVTTTLPAPTLTFNEPAADTEIMTGDSFDITWTDNGNNNPDALVTMGLDTDDDHDNGNEIILLRDDPLGNDNNMGLLTFAFFDEGGNIVPDGSYTVFATVDDGANDPIASEAPGLLVLNP